MSDDYLGPIKKYLEQSEELNISERPKENRLCPICGYAMEQLEAGLWLNAFPQRHYWFWECLGCHALLNYRDMSVDNPVGEV